MATGSKFLRISIGIAVAAAVLAAIPMVALQTPSARSFLLKAIGAAVGQQIAAGKIGGAWPDHITLDGVTVSDAQGPWMTADHLTLDWRATALLRGRVDIDALRAGLVHVLRQPVSTGGSGPSDLGGVRRTLEGLRLRNLGIDTVRLEAPVFGRAGAVGVTGAVKDERDGLAATLSLKRLDAPGTASFTLRLPPGAFALEGHAAIAGVDLDSAVTVDQGSNRLGGKVTLSCGGETPCLSWPGGSLGSVTAGAEVRGTLSAPDATVALNLRGLTDDGRTLKAFIGKVALAPGASGLALHGDGLVQGLKGALPEATDLVRDEGSWSIDGQVAGRRIVLTTATVDAGDATLTLAGAFENGAPDGVTASLNLQRAGRLLDLDDPGSTTKIDLAFSRLGFSPFIAAGHVTTAIDNPPPGMTLPRAASGALRFGAEATYTAGRLDFAAITGTFGKTTFSGSSAWSKGPQGLDHDTSSLTADVAANAIPGIASPIHLQGRLAGGLAALTLNLTATTPSVALAGSAAQDLKAVATATRAQNLWRGHVDTEGRWHDLPLAFASDFSQDSSSVLALSATTVQVLAAHLDGSLRVNTENGLLTGALAGKAADLAPLTAFLGLPANGTGDLAAAFTAGNGQRLTLNLSATQVRGDTLAAGALTAQAVVDDAWRTSALTLQAKIADGAILGRPVTQASVTANGSFARLSIQVQADGAGPGPFSLKTAGTVAVGEDIAVEIEHLTLHDGAIAAELKAPTRVTYSRTAIALAPTRLALNGGSADAQFVLDRRGDRITGAATLSQVALNNTSGLTGAARGVLDATVKLTGAASNADADGTLTVRYGGGNSGVDLTAKLNANLRGGRAAITGSATGLSAESAALAADIPARIDLTLPRLAFDMDAPIHGALAWHGEVKPLWDLLALDQHLLAGQADVDVKAEGTLDRPAVTGGVKLSKARYENLASGTALRNLEADISASGSEALAIKLAATGTGGGRIAAQGAMTLDREHGRWMVDANGDLNAFHILRRDDVTAAATGHVTYKGPLLSGTLGGRLQVVRSELRIGASYLPEIPLLRTRFSDQVAGGRQSSMRLDITLAIDDVLRVEGKGLEAFWRGELKARGNLDAPDVSGTLTLARGTFTFLGQSFDLDTGSITFTGGGKIDPELALSASRQSGDVTATVAISGRSSAPKITLSSTPALPQDEVLAQLLFRKGATQLGPIESLQLASAAADLAGLSQGGLSGLLRRTFGLDIVGFGGKNGDAVVVGHQLSSALYVGVEQSVGAANQHQIVVEWRLSRSLSLQSATNPQTGADLGLIWRKNY